MKMLRLLSIALIVVVFPGVAYGQTREHFESKLGKPTQVRDSVQTYKGPRGERVIVDFGSDERASHVIISAERSGDQKKEEMQSLGFWVTGMTKELRRLIDLAEELVPSSMRGRFCSSTFNIGNCINVTHQIYEFAVVSIDNNFCDGYSININFRRSVCQEKKQRR